MGNTGNKSLDKAIHTLKRGKQLASRVPIAVFSQIPTQSRKATPKVIHSLKIDKNYKKLQIDPISKDYLYSIIINNKKVAFIVDTGSPLSLMSKETFDKCFSEQAELKGLFKQSKNISGYTGHQVKCLGNIELSIEVPGYGKIKHDFTITKNNFDSIIGRDLLNKVRASIFCDENAMNTYIKFGKSVKTKEREYRGAIVSDITLDPLTQHQQQLILKLEAGHTFKKGRSYDLISKIHNDDTVIPSISTAKCMGQSLNLPVILNNSSDTPLLVPRGTIITLEAVPVNKKRLMSAEKLYASDFTMQNVQKIIKKKGLSIYKERVHKIVDEAIEGELSPFFDYNNCFIKALKQAPLLQDIKDEYIEQDHESDEWNTENKIGFSMEPNGMTQIDIEEHFKSYSDEVRQELIDIFVSNYSCVSTHAFDMGTCTKKVDIELACPIPKNTKTYPLSNDKLVQLRSFIEYLEFYSLIRKCDEGNQYGSPCFVISRKGANSSCRLVIDSRDANKCISGNVSAVMQSVHDEVLNLSQDLIMLTSLDLTQAYYSLALSDETLESGLSNILTPWGSYKCLRGITGWSRLPSWFNQYVREELDINSMGEYSSIFPRPVIWFDDLHQPRRVGESLDHHLSNIRSLVERLARCGFKINLKKSRFCVDTTVEMVDVLGFKVGQNKISVSPNKIKAIKDMPPPSNVKQLQSFLGSINFFRQLLPLRASHALSTLPKKIIGGKLFWDQEGQNEFDAVKQALEDLVVIRNTDNCVNLIYTDASKYALGAICFSVPLELLEVEVKNIDLTFQEITHVGLQASLKRANLDLKLLTSGRDLIECLHKVTEDMKIAHFKSCNQFQRTLFTRITLMAKTLHPVFYDLEDTSKPGILKNFENLCFNPSLPKPENYEHYMLIALSEMINRQILIINDVNDKQSHFYLGHPSKLSPLILFYCKNTTYYYILGSPKPFLDHESSNHNHKPNIPGDEIVKGFHRYLKKVTYAEQDTLGRRVTVLGYHSKAFSKSDILKSTYERECLAIFRSLMFFKNETLANKSFILTDSQPAFCLFNVKGNCKNKKVLNIHLQLITEFSHVSILSIPGRKMLADFMTRTGINESINLMPVYKPNHNTGLDEVMYFETFSSYYSFLESQLVETSTPQTVKVNIIQESLLTSTYDKFLGDESFKKHTLEMIKDHHFKMTPKHILSNGFLYNDAAQRIIPPGLEYVLISYYHCTKAHRTSLGLLKLISKDFGILDRKTFLEKIDIFVASCVACHTSKPNRQRLEGGAIFLDVTRPVQYLSMDFMEEHHAPGNYNVKQRLVIIDHFSSKLFCYFLPTAKVESVIQCLLNFFSEHGICNCLLTDKASYFSSDKFKSFLHKFGVKLIDSSPRRSQARGRVERSIQKIREVIKMLSSTSRYTDYVELTTLAIRIINSTCETNIELSPDELFLGGGNIRKPFLTQEQLRSPLTLTSQTEQERREARRSFNLVIRDVIKKRRDTRLAKLAKANKNKTKLQLEPGGFVLVKTWSTLPGVQLSSAYSRVPHLALHVYDHQIVCKNVLTGAIVKRHKMHVKVLKVDKIKKLQLPEAILNMLDVFTVVDFLPVSKPLDELVRSGPITRGQIAADKFRKDKIDSSDSDMHDEVHFLVPYQED